jgi:hypothetical protein
MTEALDDAEFAAAAPDLLERKLSASNSRTYKFHLLTLWKCLAGKGCLHRGPLSRQS